MKRAEFLRSLFQDGRVRVGQWGDPLEAGEELAMAEQLAHAERVVRAEFPGEAPEYEPAAALWAANLFYIASQLVVYRTVGPEEVARTLAPAGDAATRFPDPTRAESHYAVDQVFRFLPDLMRLATSAARADPLVKALGQWAGDWPLSSVGMDGVSPCSLEAIVTHRGLLACYVDRILRHRDAGRLQDERVRKAARAALGAYSSLAETMERALNVPAVTDPTSS